MHEDWIDRWRGLLIFLVVCGHVAGGAYHLTQNVASQNALQYAFKAIYLFHMPAFFVLAGFTFKARQRSLIDDWKWFVRKSMRLLIPYFIWGGVSIAIYCLFSHGTSANVEMYSTTAYYQTKAMVSNGVIRSCLSLIHAGGWPDGEGFRCNSVLWFLPCMFVTLLALRIVSQGGKIWVALGAVLGLCADLFRVIPGGLPWGLSQLPRFFFYISCGWFVAMHKSAHYDLRGRSFLLCALVSLSCYLGFAYFLPDPSSIREGLFGACLLQIFAIAGCVVSALIAKLLRSRLLVIMGINAMGIMLIHKFLVVLFELKAPFVRAAIGCSPIGAVVGMITLSALVSFLCIFILSPIRRFSPWAIGEDRRRVPYSDKEG